MADVLKVQSSSGTNHFSVDDSGNATIPGALAVTGATTLTGAATLGAVTATSLTTTVLASTGAPQVIDMADDAVEIVYGITAGAGQVAVTTSRLLVDPNSGGASEDLTIDTTAAGLVLVIKNTGGEDIVVKSNGGSTYGTIAAGGIGVLWAGLLMLGA